MNHCASFKTLVLSMPNVKACSKRENYFDFKLNERATEKLLRLEHKNFNFQHTRFNIEIKIHKWFH